MHKALSLVPLLLTLGACKTECPDGACQAPPGVDAADPSALDLGAPPTGDDLAPPACAEAERRCAQAFSFIGAADRVEVRGTFPPPGQTGGDTWGGGVAMTRRDNSWVASIPIPWNTRQAYKFYVTPPINGSSWLPDPNNPEQEPDGFGGKNSVIKPLLCDVWTCAAACVGEDDAAVCARAGRECGSYTGADRCGTSRTVGCGTCAAPQTCGGGGAQGRCGSGGACVRACMGKTCGTDYCGGSCGTCATTETCGSVNNDGNTYDCRPQCSFDYSLRGSAGTVYTSQSWLADVGSCYASLGWRTVGGSVRRWHTTPAGFLSDTNLNLNWSTAPAPGSSYTLVGGAAQPFTVRGSVSGQGAAADLLGSYDSSAVGSRLVVRVDALSPVAGGAYAVRIEPGGVLSDGKGRTIEVQGTFQGVLQP